MTVRILTLEIRQEADIVLARQRARQIASLLGFPLLDQTRIATATSEIARNAYQYAGGGKAEFLVEQAVPRSLVVRILERGPGIENLQAILDGEYASATGLGLGIIGARRLMDRFEIATAPGGGATVTMAKYLPGAVELSPQALSRVSTELAKNAPQGLLDELQQQNQELMRALQVVREQQAESMELHRRELEETNRGVVALYAELDDNAKVLKRISELKSRFLSNMSHEFRSPLNTIMTLSAFLMDRSDGELTAEQEKQVAFIQRAADGLSALVNDLLDLAKVEAGKAVVRPKSFDVSELFEGLRGTIRPLLVYDSVSLLFEEPPAPISLRTDEGKLGQILRNFLSNAVKFTERGEIRVSAAPGPGDTVIFSVLDTGVGIAPEDRDRIFEEFGQVENPLQGRVKGTGLGLPLSRKLAELLGGNVSVKSQPGVGSTFFAVVPRVYNEPGETEIGPNERWKLEPGRLPLLAVEDDPVDMLLYEKILQGTEFQLLPARTLDEARRVLKRVRPVAILLDILLEVESGWTLLTELKSQAATRDVPVLVLTVVDGQERALTLGADGFCLKPIDQRWLLERLGALAERGPVETVLIIDDTESDRRLLRELLIAGGQYRVVEAGDGASGLRRASEDGPSVIFLDLVMQDMTGLEVLDRLKHDAATRDIPVIINTSKDLEDDEREKLSGGAAAIVEKITGSRQESFDRIRQALIKAGLQLVATESEA